MLEPKIRPLSPELQARACKELNEDPKRRAADIAHIREWLNKQPHILGNPDDQTIVTFLRGCKFSLERTKEKLDLYYTVRTALPEIFQNRNVYDPKLREVLQLGGLIALPEADDQGRHYVLFRPRLWDPRYNIDDITKVQMMIADVLLRGKDSYLIYGTASIIDMAELSMAHVAIHTPSMIKKLFVIFQDALPNRVKCLHHINCSPIAETLFNLIKSVSKEKMKSRMYLHGTNSTSFNEVVPQKIMPTEYGGNAGSCDELNALLIKALESYHDWFMSPEGSAGVDESKRPGKSKTQHDLFGQEGSFRKLDFD